MMSYIVKCVNCGQELEAEEDYAGQEATCPTCGKPFIVPAQDSGEIPAVAEENAAVQEEQEQEHEAQFRHIVSRIRLGYYEEALDYIHKNNCTDVEVLTLKMEMCWREGTGKWMPYELGLKGMIGYKDAFRVGLSKNFLDNIGQDANKAVKYLKLEAKAAVLAGTTGGAQAAMRWLKSADEYAKQAENIQEDAETYILWGTAKCILEDYDGAVEDFQTALRLEPDNTYAYSGMARTLLEQLEYAPKMDADQYTTKLCQVTDYAQKSLEVEPEEDKTNWEARMVLAAAMLDRENAGFELEQCLDLLLDAIRIAPHEPSLYAMVVEALNKGDVKITDFPSVLGWEVKSPEDGGWPYIWCLAASIAEQYPPMNARDATSTEELELLARAASAIVKYRRTGSAK